MYTELGRLYNSGSMTVPFVAVYEKKMACAGSWTGGLMTIECAREVEMGILGRILGVQGPVVTTTVSAERVAEGSLSEV